MEYCVYWTTYNGDKMPHNYIGSSSVQRVNGGYRGSVQSKKWKQIWAEELSNRPDLFETKIISTHETRELALAEELRLQQKLNVVLSEDWINESYAQVNGYAGRDVSGTNNPMYGRGDKVKKWCVEHPDKVSQRNRKAALTQWQNSETRVQRVNAMKGKIKTRKNLTEEEFRLLQKQKAEKAAQSRRVEIEYNGVLYYGWNNLLEVTGVTKHLYIKYYLKGQDPLARKDANGPIKQT